MNRFRFVLLLLIFITIFVVSTASAYRITTVAGGGTISPTIGLPATNIDIAVLSKGKIDRDGYLHIASYNSWYFGQNWSVTRVNPWGVIDRVYSDPQLINYPVNFDDICIDGEGNIYLPSYIGSVVYKVTPAGVTSIYAGNGTEGTGGDGGPATEAQLSWAESVTMDLNGNLFIAHYNNSPVIRKVNRDGIISTLFDGTSLGIRYVDSLHADGLGNVYFFDDTSWRVFKVNPQGVASVVAGNGTKGSSGESVFGTQAQLNYVSGITSDDWGNLFITNKSNGSGIIRKVDAFGIITTVASFPVSGAGEDFYATRLSTDRDGMIYFTNYETNSTVQRLSFPPEVSTAVPTLAAIGERIKITGRYFTSQGTAGTVTFGGIQAAILSWSNDTIVCTIPAGVSKTTDVVVTAPDGQTSNVLSYRVR